MNFLAPVAAAALPQTYVAAQNALAQCQAIDECKDWADKAAALASYARQSEDLELEKMAQRIRARAMRRAGELAKQMMQPQGTNRFTADRVEADRNSIPREAVKEVSGFSDHQLRTAINVAAVPEPQFTAQVESSNPPTVTELARQGTVKREPPPPSPEQWLKGRDGKTYNAILHMISAVEEYAEETVKWSLDSLLPSLNDDERQRLRQAVSAIDAIHDKIVTRI